MTPSAVDHIPGTILVMEDGLVDGLGSVVKFVDEGMAQVIFIWTLGLVGDGNSDASDGGVVLYIVGSEEEIIFTILFGDGGGPHGASGPADGAGVEDMFVLLPVDEIGRGKGVEEHLLVVFGGIGRVYPVSVTEYGGFRVGVPPGEEGVAGGLGLGSG